MKFTAFGQNNAQMLTSAAYLKQVLQTLHGRVSYHAQTAKGYAVLWTDGKTIGYETGIVGKGSIDGYILQYPVSQKVKFDTVISHINSSLQAPETDQSH